MKIKKSKIVPILEVLLWFNPETKQPVSGLLTEKISMSLRRRLQRIRVDVLAEFKKLGLDEKELNESFTGEELSKEIAILLDEEIEINQEFVSLEQIEQIETSVNYDFGVIELIAR